MSMGGEDLLDLLGEHIEREMAMCPDDFVSPYVLNEGHARESLLVSLSGALKEGLFRAALQQRATTTLDMCLNHYKQLK